MSDKPYYHEENEVVLLRSWVLRHMMRGASWAAMGVICFIVIFLVLQGVSRLLPEESKQAPSPYISFDMTESSLNDFV